MKRVVKNGGESVLGVGFVWSSWDLKVSHEHGLGGLAGIIGQDHRTELLSTVQKSAELKVCDLCIAACHRVCVQLPKCQSELLLRCRNVAGIRVHWKQRWTVMLHWVQAQNGLLSIFL